MGTVRATLRVATLLVMTMLSTTPALADERIDAIRAEVRAGNAERAEDLAENLIEVEPGNAEAHNVYGEVLTVRINQVNVFRKPGMAGRMRKAWEHAIELDPSHLDARRSLMQYYLQAPAIAGGSRDKALEQTRTIAGIDRAAGYRAMAVYWTAEDDLEKAAAEYGAAVEEFPEDIDLRFEYGLYLQQVEDWDAAYASFMAILEREPGDLRAQYQIGRNAVMSGRRLDEGAAALKWYLTQEPGDGDAPHAWAHTRLGQVYARMGRMDDARAQFDAALVLDPEHEEAKKQLAAIK